MKKKFTNFLYNTLKRSTHKKNIQTQLAAVYENDEPAWKPVLPNSATTS